MHKSKKTSSGVIYTDGTLILIGHATGTSHWDIPKGKLNDGESACDAVIRETKEETGLILDVQNLIDLGCMPYTRSKNLHLWKYVVDKLPDISIMHCDSTFIDRFGKTVPELNKFQYVTLNDSLNFVSKSMMNILKNIRL